MKISTKGRYGLEALADLALHSHGDPVNLRDISDRCNISHSYMLQIFLVLRRAGIVNSIRGAQGGYVLAEEASDISVYQVLEALEGPLSPAECLSEDRECCRRDICPTRDFWNQMAEEMKEAVSGITMEDIIDCAVNQEGSVTTLPDYVI